MYIFDFQGKYNYTIKTFMDIPIKVLKYSFYVEQAVNVRIKYLIMLFKFLYFRIIHICVICILMFVKFTFSDLHKLLIS